MLSGPDRHVARTHEQGTFVVRAYIELMQSAEPMLCLWECQHVLSGEAPQNVLHAQEVIDNQVYVLPHNAIPPETLLRIERGLQLSQAL